MYKHLLVPLDRSDLAEQALPHAAELAQAMKARITLVVVVPVLDPETVAAAGAAYNWQAEVADDHQYLQGLCARLHDSGVPCAAEVLNGDIGDAIVSYADEHDCDLIVMSTHGRSGLGRWIYGSIADRVLTHTQVPLLLVRATAIGEA